MSGLPPSRRPRTKEPSIECIVRTRRGGSISMITRLTVDGIADVQRLLDSLRRDATKNDTTMAVMTTSQSSPNVTVPLTEESPHA